MRTPRDAARVAVLDPQGAIFLFRYDNEEIGVHWSMPGGGLDPGESWQRGALRELREETGWTDIAVDGTELCRWQHDYTRPEGPVRQSERIYLARGPRRDLGPGLRAAHREDGILDWHWWTPAELAADHEPLWPPQLPELLTAVREKGAPSAPVELGFVPNGPVVRDPVRRRPR